MSVLLGFGCLVCFLRRNIDALCVDLLMGRGGALCCRTFLVFVFVRLNIQMCCVFVQLNILVCCVFVQQSILVCCVFALLKGRLFCAMVVVNIRVC